MGSLLVALLKSTLKGERRIPEPGTSFDTVAKPSFTISFPMVPNVFTVSSLMLKSFAELPTVSKALKLFTIPATLTAA